MTNYKRPQEDDPKRYNETEENPLMPHKKEVEQPLQKEEQQLNDRKYIDREELRQHDALTPARDKPDLVDSDNASLFDLHEDMQTVDPLPVEELNDEVKDEKHKEHTKDTSSSERRHEADED
ncbi:hypothetical protein [Caryophanon tenue]|uniref:hypothetical protein n=1 Tax=Caryophanon tenue TaxID=33978 RepID=UPI000ACBB414